MDEYCFLFPNLCLAHTLHSPLSASDSSPPLSARTLSPITKSIEAEPRESALTKNIQPVKTITDLPSITTSYKDFSFLLDAAIYHPLGQIDIPAPFRQPFPPPPTPNTAVSELFANIELLLAACNFIGAAHQSGLALTSGIISSTDANSIFHLLSIRYSSLELSGNVLLAAQEAKALEDLSSTFYYLDKIPPNQMVDLPNDKKSLLEHIVPFDLRLQALRLQSIGFSDPRRGISALYDLGLECREHIASSRLTEAEALLWSRRLDEVGVRVVNALIDQGDLDCAYRTLESMQPEVQNSMPHWIARMILLCIKMGRINQAEKLVQSSQMSNANRNLLDSLLSVAKGKYEDAAQLLSTSIDQDSNSALQAIVEQNLACAYLYAGRISDCRQILEKLVDDGYSFQTLTVNLATIYELTSDRAQDSKIAMANKVAAGTGSAGPKRAFINSSFKL